MKDTVASSEQSNRLDALDPGLPFLASQAAIELDNILLGQDVELQAACFLAERIQNSTEENPGNDDRKSLMDPATITLFSSAVAASGIQNLRTLDDLANEAWRLANALRGSATETDRERIERLRTFCTFLAQSAVAHERQILERQTSDKNWS